jgi:hypothetical protein
MVDIRVQIQAIRINNPSQRRRRVMAIIPLRTMTMLVILHLLLRRHQKPRITKVTRSQAKPIALITKISQRQVPVPAPPAAARHLRKSIVLVSLVSARAMDYRASAAFDKVATATNTRTKIRRCHHLLILNQRLIPMMRRNETQNKKSMAFARMGSRASVASNRVAFATNTSRFE